MQATDAGTQRLYLLGFDATGNGRAIVAVGNPDTADNVVTYVPGTGAGLDAVRGDLGRADIMTREANTHDPARRTVAVCWIGYDAPQDIVPQAARASYAIAAGADLDRFQDGLRVTHDGPRSHHTVVGHSYGSTVVGYTASRHGLDADELVFLGSPGVGTATVGGLTGADGHPVPPEHVWSSHARNDPIQYASYTDFWPFSRDGRLEPADVLVHGTNPSEPEFGARTFRSDPGEPLRTMHAHSQYWDPYCASLRNLTYIATGHPELVR
jgi:pimeloyl-ACP methyl ester carboxylesterase